MIKKISWRHLKRLIRDANNLTIEGVSVRSRQELKRLAENSAEIGAGRTPFLRMLRNAAASPRPFDDVCLRSKNDILSSDDASIHLIGIRNIQNEAFPHFVPLYEVRSEFGMFAFYMPFGGIEVVD